MSMNKTKDLFSKVYAEDLKKKSPTWCTGWPMFDSAIINLEQGLIILSAIENIGKSNFGINLYQRILDHTPNSRVVDLVVDDSSTERVRNLVASKSVLSMGQVALPSMLDADDPETESILKRRKDAYDSFINDYSDRLDIIDSSYADSEGGKLSFIDSYVRDLRKKYPEDRIWVNLDAFDDPELPAGVIGNNEPVKYTSKVLKRLCSEANVVVFASKHTTKYNRGRNADADTASGSGKLKYDCKAILNAYSDAKEKGYQAEIYHTDPDDPTIHRPIFEVSFKKNKVSSFCGRLFYYQWPEAYFCTECDKETSDSYEAMIRASVGKDEMSNKK